MFKYLEEKGQLKQEEMFNIFNMGIGMVAVVKKEEAEQVVAHFEQCGEKASLLVALFLEKECLSTDEKNCGFCIRKWK